MNIKLLEESDNRVVYKISGQCIHEYVSKLKELRDIRKDEMVLDMSNCIRIDSSGIGQLISIHNSRNNKKQILIIKCLRYNILEKFYQVGLHKVFNIE